MKIPAAAIALLFALCLTGCSDKKEPETVTQREEIIWVGDFTTSVKRQLEKEGILKAFASASKITVQLVWSDEAASEKGMIVEERIQPQSTPLELNADHKKLLADIFNENTDYQESIASCLCIFRPQLRVVFFSKDNKTRYDILISGISHSEIQTFKNKEFVEYARCGHFKPAYLKFLDAVFPDHELTKMLHRYNETGGAGY